MSDSDLIAKGLTAVSNHEGLEFSGDDIIIKGRCIDAYLLTAVIAMRLQAGDIEITEIKDSLGKKSYYDRLVKSMGVG